MAQHALNFSVTRKKKCVKCANVDYNEEVAEMMAVVNRVFQSCSVDPEKVLHNLVFVYYILLDNISNAITYFSRVKNTSDTILSYM